MQTITILGQPYTIEYHKSAEDKNIGNGVDAYCDWTTRTIVLQDQNDIDGDLGNMKAYWKKTLRHEIIHAFLYECGLAQNSTSVDAWAQNEEMVDWFAFMGKKIYTAWKEAGCL